MVVILNLSSIQSREVLLVCGILYMTHYVLVAALPIVITSELSGSDLDAGPWR